MILCDKYRFAFVHIPKTGGCSITAMFVEFLKPPPYKFEGRGWQFRYHTGGMHSRGCKPPDTHFCFTVARNTWSRVAEAYNSKFGKKSRSIGEFINSKPWVCLPMQDYINFDLLSDHIRFEFIEQDFLRICEKLKIPINKPFPHIAHRSPAYDHSVPWYRDLYDERTNKMIRKMYAQEIERYGFEF